MSTPKEIHYFGQNDPAKTPSWYQSFFTHASESAIGEGSTSYTHPKFIERSATAISEAIPDCRLIYLVRNPLKRLESDWKMRWREGWTDSSINAAVFKQDSLITHGLYWKNISVFRKYFPDEQILILFLEDFSQTPKQELEKCFRHIGVDPRTKIEGLYNPRNQSTAHRQDRLPVRLLRSTPLFERVKNIAPEIARDFAKGVFTKKHIPPPADWDPDVRSDTIARFRADAREILKHCHKEPDFWTYD